MIIPRPRKPRADPNPDETADVVDISTSMSPELTETLTSRVLSNDQVLAQLHHGAGGAYYRRARGHHVDA